MKKTPAKKAAQNPPAKKRRVTFAIQSEPGRKVAVAGTFNHWDAETNLLKDKNKTGAYALAMLLPPGAHEYKFVIDGAWCVDPACSEWVQNDRGTLNSLLHI